MERLSDDIDTSNWVVVDVAEEAILLNQNGSDSDLDSEGSISIISEIPAESCSEDEDFQNNLDLTNNEELPTEDVKGPSEVNESDVDKIEVANAFAAHESSPSTAEPDANFSCANPKLHLDAETGVKFSEKPNFDITTRNSEMCDLPVSILQTHISPAIHENNSLNLPLKHTIIINNSMLVGVIILLASILIRQYLTDSKQLHLDAPNIETLGPGKNYFIEEAIGFCIQKHLVRALEKRSTKVDKCVEKRIRKLYKADMVTDVEQDLQLRQKWFDMVQNRQFENVIKTEFNNFNRADKSKEEKRNQVTSNNKEKLCQNSFSCNKDSDEFTKGSKKIKCDKPKEKIRHKWEKYNNIQKKNLKYDPDRFVEEANLSNEKNYDSYIVDKKKTYYKVKNTKLNRASPGNVKKGKNKNKYVLKNTKNAKPKLIEKPKMHPNNKQTKNGKYNLKCIANDEWYLKCIPVEDTVELINVLKNDDRRFILLENSNKTVNGQWYVNLNLARSRFRKNDITANWFFDRAIYRDGKRNKAKWYFDYMTAREENRYTNQIGNHIF